MALDDDALTPGRYGAALQVLHAARLGWEPGIEERLPGSTGPHGDWLAADLAHLGLVPIPQSSPLNLPSAAAAWGARYVLEGSALGGRMLLRRVAPLGFTAAHGARYFAGYGETTGSRWRGFLARLEAEPNDPDDVVAGACSAFDALAHVAASHRAVV